MPPAPPLVEVAFELVHLWGFVGLFLGGFLGFILALVAERSDAIPERRSLQPGESGGGLPLPCRSLAGEAVVASGAVWVLPLLAILVATTTTTVLVMGASASGAPVPPRLFATTLTVPLFPWAAIPLIVPGAVTALVQLAAAVAGRGRPAPLRSATRAGRRALVVVLCLGAGLYEWNLFSPAARVAVIGAAVLLPLAWAALSARTGGPGTRLVLLLALAGLGLGELPREIHDRANVVRVLSAILLNAVLPAVVACAALNHTRIGRRTLDVLGVEVEAPGDLAAASLLIAPVLYVAAGFALEASGSHALARWLVEDAHALHWTPILTTGLFAAAILYLRRIVDEARGAARERAAARDEAAATAPAPAPAPEAP